MMLMWETGVEGDKFNVHIYTATCQYARCVPLTNTELAAFVARYSQLSSEFHDGSRLSAQTITPAQLKP
jgi:hypothetical protein